jgi:homoserine O-acetyltransferase/O-succinyltransferase
MSIKPPHSAAAQDENELNNTETKFFTFNDLVLESGEILSPVTIAYETYGGLNGLRDNAILICHALTGDAHAAGISAETGKAGWWDSMIGPGKAFDTDRYFVICSNIIGGCKGSTGPSSVNPKTGNAYGSDFPVITIGDMVNAQVRLADYLGIDKLLSVAGGSMGGMQVLEWMASHPERVRSAIPISTAARHSPQQIAFNEVGRQAIMADPNWNDGNYYGGSLPGSGLSVARMLGHITYMSDISMRKKFGRRFQDDRQPFKFTAEFQVEGYLHYRGHSFIERFDANSYLFITKAMDHYDVSRGRKLHEAFSKTTAKVLMVAFQSDWLYPLYQSEAIVKACKLAGVDATYCVVDSTYGHDAFLIETEEETHLIKHYLEGVTRENGTVVFDSDRPASLAYRVILDMVRPGSAVLDLGCGDGTLLTLLVQENNARAQGIEKDSQAIYKCVARGLSVFHGDLDTGLSEYGDNSFDYVILNESLQQVALPDRVLTEALRVSKEVIVGVPNFGHYASRSYIFFKGKAPVTQSLPYEWYDTPNLHFLSISDFVTYCNKRTIIIKDAAFIRKNKIVNMMPNFFAEIGIFLITK